ncbi:Fe(3+)-hydroxamate ABC transporter permease FhuB [Aurantimonas sp. DM33-3]|uniref:Fe(3+)-hydroxamate ABC transporter permease FhuB n=1 Tax=Aurantimonas sp. DM33-3 TaxID=2766955 RepID=UPI00165206EA|nr:Fe(3+)-hydroxamate ABC transporter permease FhuB [Aurantimonas sp. DM33-3]MBC6715918.1 Fe(3+)-hydroxamate ABC transporter permease FhuB [Aurantimonas sp. DM33-3]
MILSQSLTGPARFGAALALVAAVLTVAVVAAPIADLWAGAPTGGYDPARILFLHAELPRLAMAVLCGGALSASGAILQQVLRNPLAAPTTLGIDAGARLALALATLFAPALFGFGRDLVAITGSAASTLIVFMLVRRNFSAVSLILAGLVVSLYCGALSAILIMIKDRYLVSLFIWGAGSLAQQSWQPTIDLAMRLAVLVVPVWLLVRPLSLLELGDASVASLGLNVTRIRIGAIGLAVLLAGFVTSAVGVIGFIGLVAPILARLAGARQFGERLVWSSIIGALLLLATDCAVTLLSGVSAEFLPTGAVTAIFGSPLLLFLLPRLRASVRPPFEASVPQATARFSPALRLALCVTLALSLVAVLFLGRDATGAWQILPADAWAEILPWRAPRLIAAAAAGAMVAVAGFILQRLTGNEMASPEVLGVSAGAAFAFALSLFVFDDLGLLGESLVTSLGGLAVLVAIIFYARRTGFSPETILLAGIALNALLDAFVGVLAAGGDPRAFILVDWMGGSTQGLTMADAIPVAIAALVLVAAGLPVLRWLAILPLGDRQAAALGVPLAYARPCLLVLAALLTAAATPIIGPLTFVGLMAPHVVRMLGIRRPLPTLLVAALAGAAIMAVADFLARTIAFPYQLPTGLVAALVGAPVLLILLGRKGSTS